MQPDDTERTAMTRPGWTDSPDPTHTIRWTPADQAGPDAEAAQYLTIDEAAHRLAAYGAGENVETISFGLATGAMFRTPYAYYQLDSAARAAETTR